MSEYYDGTKLLSLKDINGKKPEIYICTGNRTAGKTTYFNRFMVNDWLKRKEKFCLLYRFNYELANCAERFFKDIQFLFFPNHHMDSKSVMNGAFHELYMDDQPCGYAVALNKADTIKKCSHLFNDVCRILFDEFQPETNHYCPDELTKFQSVHMSMARGKNQMTRYVPVYMVSNTVSILNPYYTAMGIAPRLRSDTKYLKGPGYVLENTFNEAAANAVQSSGFNQAFAGSGYVKYASENVYLNDNTAFIEKPAGTGKYICTLKFHDKEYAIREYAAAGYLYCDDRPDGSFPRKIAVTTDDHQINYVMLKNNDLLIESLRQYFRNGCFRFKNLESKACVLAALSY